MPSSFLAPAVSRRRLLLGAGAAALLAGCSASSESSSAKLTISAIPDQDPELLNRLYNNLADRFADATDLEVAYQPVADYTAVVRAFELGDVQLAWMGGLTGVQARSRVAGAQAIAQRDIDQNFRSVFIANRRSGLIPIDDVGSLRSLRGHTLTFGSETSTSGRLMPQYFLQEAGVELSALAGPPGFSGSHDATIEVVANGSFEVGAVNEQVWRSTVERGEVNLDDVIVLWRTPGYADYHWLVRPDIDETLGAGTQQKIKGLLLGLDVDEPADAEILRLFGAGAFVGAANSDYDRIETVANDLGMLR